MNKEKIKTALALMNSMILGGEQHSEKSQEILKEALEELKKD